MTHVDADRVRPAGRAATLQEACDCSGPCRLRDGTEILVRLARPDDATACCAMLEGCSPKSLYARYEKIVAEPLEGLAQRLCCPDLEGELTVVAVAGGDRTGSVVAVAQLFADPSHQAAEYAVLVADPWQSRGLGSALTDRCLQLAQAWGIERVVAEFLPENMRMIRILEKRAFELMRNRQEHVVSGQKRTTGDGRPRVPAHPAS